MPVSSKEFLDIQGTIECGFALKHVRDMIRFVISISVNPLFLLKSAFLNQFMASLLPIQLEIQG